jgi:hypothetical protein
MHSCVQPSTDNAGHIQRRHCMSALQGRSNVEDSRAKPKATGHGPTCSLLSYRICAKKSAMLTALVEWDEGKPASELEGLDRSHDRFS